MVNEFPFQFLLVDNESLAQYKSGAHVKFNDIKRRLLLKTRDQNKSIPDHYYRLIIETAFKGTSDICDIFNISLPKLAASYFYNIDNRIYVITNKQNDWQELITFFPPLFLQCAYLHGKINTRLMQGDYATFFRDMLLPNTKYTCIPSARITQLDFFVQQQEGLHDLHMHLNGSLETDQVWQDYLRIPNDIYHQLKSAFKNEKVREQLEQESLMLEAKSFKELLLTAQNLRVFFYEYLFNRSSFKSKPDADSLLADILNPEGSYKGSYSHPFQQLITTAPEFKNFMSIEALMYILLLQEIREFNPQFLANLLHFYLLILGLTNRLLVQQTHQTGFEQFQKHTLNGLRSKSEEQYMRRYYQLHGNDIKNIKFLEGRFSPKKMESDTRRLVDEIFRGWDDLIKTIKQEQKAIKKTPNLPELKLTAHFIKAAEKSTEIDDIIRHKALRYDTWMKAKSLTGLLQNHDYYREKIVAVDAAASEFDAPPEVFASTFRLMRRAGIKHFTYHAGEDFFHVISGLRAIYEAIVFCDLRNGDRIGHATASGLSVKQWKNEIGNKILIRQGEYLDNLVFTYYLIVQYRLENLHKLLPFITNKVQNLSYTVYNNHYSMEILVHAWKLRQCCPLHLFEREIDNVTSGQRNEDEWDFPILANLIESRDYDNNTAWKILKTYHDKAVRIEYEKVIAIDPFEIVCAEDLELLQLGLLAEMNHREIVIETLPTSNVRIGFHKNFNSYHLWNWIKWKKEGYSIPPIVVGSDDTGIFATNIYNEYANIYCMLLNHYKLSHSQIMIIIKQLDEDSRIYRFE